MILVLVLLSVLCSTLHAEIDCPGLTVIPWRGRNPSCQLESIEDAVSQVIIHQTAGPACELDPVNPNDNCIGAVRNIQIQHMDKNKWKDIGYNFLIDEEGQVYEGRGWETLAYYARYYNKDSISIAFIGTFTCDKKPEAEALGAAKQLIQCGVNKDLINENPTVKVFSEGETIYPGSDLHTELGTWDPFEK